MSTRSVARLTLAVAAVLSLASAASAQSAVARLGTYEKDGQAYFALSLMPQVAADASQKNEVVILVDTSASQAGRYRAEEMAALSSLLSSLSPDDRTLLMAVDMKATPMSAGFVAPQSAEMQAALSKLSGRTPLGATDLEAGLRSAAASFAGDGAARNVIYIGDAMSKANLLTDATIRKLVDDLRDGHVSVSSFVVGQEQNTQLMAALANHTGGQVQTAQPQIDASMNGRSLAAAVRASVVWPSEVALSADVASMYPAEMPPVRSDRDSIMIGTLNKVAPVNVEMNGTLNGKPVTLKWTAMPERSSDDFGFLPKLVDLAAADKGLSLPTAGSGGLREAAYVTMNSAQQLAKLGNEALASGNFAGAEKVANAALARDPGNPEAQAIKEAARKGMATGKPQPTSEPELKLTGLSEAPAPGGLLAEVLSEPPSGFLGRVDAERSVMAGKIRAEVENNLNAARKVMGTSPDQAEQDLKLTLENIERTPDLDPEVRAQLRQQVENAIRLARQRKVEVDQQVAVAQEHKAAALDQERLNDALTLQVQRVKQIVDRFGSLMAEQRWAAADEEIVPEIQRMAPYSTIDSSMTYAGRYQRAHFENDVIWRKKYDQYLRTLQRVEVAMIPFPDEPPIVYMPSNDWEDLTRRRQKYKAVDLGKQGGAEQRIFQELSKNTIIEVVEMPLKDVVLYLQENHNIPIVLSTKKLDEASVSVDTPVTKTLKGVTLRSALRLILKDMELTYVIRDEVLQITTPEDAESQLITKVYPVGDLVVPVMSGGGGMMGGGMMGGMGGGMMGGMGGMGGGMMGGGMGGMGGGMGGMGGMGGGMGGMGGGMGGGMFAIEDELTLGTKKTSPANADAAAPQPQPELRPAKPRKPAQRIVLQPAAGQSLADAWDGYFAAQEERFASLEDSAPAVSESLASVRETVRRLMGEKKYGEVSTVIQSAIRHGEVESWMYEALALAMRADALDKVNQGAKIDEAQSEALERALLSAVDFAKDDDQLVLIAAYMAQAGLERRALSVYQQISKANPLRPEPYLQGLALAQRLNDVDAIQWACVGVLSQEWSGEQRELGERAFRIGKAVYQQLLADGLKSQAEAFDAARQKAQERDCVFVVTWTGNADIDLAVEEPAGTVVSQRQPRSTSGGVHLGDVSAADGKSTTKGFTEAYVCPQAFTGEYRAMIKSVWGRPTSGKVTIDIYRHYGTDQQTVEHVQIPLDGKNAVVLFDVKGGRRQDPLPDAQVAQVAKIQNVANRAVLAQQLAGLGGQSSQSFASSVNTLGGLGFVPGFFLRGAVGYRPVISQFPTGANMSSNAVISADRRYVRVSPSPLFSQITEVNTFNFVTGQGGTQGAGQGGVGGGSGGGFGGAGVGGGGSSGGFL